MLTFLAMANVVLTLSLWRFQWGALPKMGWVTPMTLGPTGFVTALRIISAYPTMQNRAGADTETNDFPHLKRILIRFETNSGSGPPILVGEFDGKGDPFPARQHRRD